MTWTFCSSEAMIRKAGVNANSDIVASGAFLAEVSDQVEAAINMESRKDWITDYTSIGANYQKALAIIAASLGGNLIVNYDTSGYTNSAEYQTILDVNSDNARKYMKLLAETKYQEAIV